jgi:hypothetical protein
MRVLETIGMRDECPSRRHIQKWYRFVGLRITVVTRGVSQLRVKTERRELPVEKEFAPFCKDFFFDRLPVAHRSWVHPSRQLFHPRGLWLCQGTHNSTAARDVVADRGQALQNRLPLFPVELP